MTKVYLLQNEIGVFLSKQLDWDETHASLYFTEHKDEAINTRVEITVKNPSARLFIVPSTLNEKGIPCIPPTIKD